MMRVDSTEEQWAKIHFKAITDKKLKYKARHVADYPKGNPIWVTLVKDVGIQNNWIITDDVVDIYQNDTFKITSHLDHPKYKYSYHIGSRIPEPLLKAEKGKVTAYICGILFKGKNSIEIRKDKLIYVDGVDCTPAHLRPVVNQQKAVTSSQPNVNQTPAEEKLASDPKKKQAPELFELINNPDLSTSERNRRAKACIKTTVGMVDENDETPLILAAKKGYVDIVRWLLETHADPNYHSKKTQLTALICAAREGHAEIVEILIKAKSDLELVNVNTTALDEAVANEKLNTVRLLLTHGARIWHSRQLFDFLETCDQSDADLLISLEILCKHLSQNQHIQYTPEQSLFEKADNYLKKLTTPIHQEEKLTSGSSQVPERSTLTMHLGNRWDLTCQEIGLIEQFTEQQSSQVILYNDKGGLVSGTVDRPPQSVDMSEAESKTQPTIKISSSADILKQMMPKLSLASTPKPPKEETKAQPKSSSQQNKVESGKWLAEMRAMIAGRNNVADVCVETESGLHVQLSNEKPLTGDDILRAQKQFR